MEFGAGLGRLGGSDADCQVGGSTVRSILDQLTGAHELCSSICGSVASAPDKSMDELGVMVRINQPAGDSQVLFLFLGDGGWVSL